MYYVFYDYVFIGQDSMIEEIIGLYFTLHVAMFAFIFNVCSIYSLTIAKKYLTNATLRFK